MTQSERGKDGAPSGRSPADVTSLLVELARALKARQFYDADDPQFALVLARAVRAWQADLARHGPLEFEVAATGIRVPALALKISSVQVGALLRCLSGRGARSLHFDGALDGESFGALVELLAGEPSDLERERGIEQALYGGARAGIVLNRVEPERALPPRAAPAAREHLDPPAASEPDGSAPTVPILECDPREGSLDLEVDDEPGADPGPSREVQATPAPAPSDAAPASTGASDTRALQVRHLLRELAECDDDLAYNELARRLEMLSAALSEEGDPDPAFAAIALFSEHAGDEAKRTPRQRQLALEELQTLVRGARLEDLIDRACTAGERTSVGATQVLLQLGEGVAPRLFEVAEQETDANRRGQLHGILIAMGDTAIAELLRAMDEGPPEVARSAVRLAGEMQNPVAVPRLAELLTGSDSSLRQEAAKALVRIGDPRALEVLVRALRSPVPDLPNLAAFCLGAAGTRRAAQALLAALDHAIDSHRFAFAAEVIRALGRLGRAEATPALADLLQRRSLRKRRQFRDLKLAALAALGRLPGDDAVGALAQAARARDPQLRRAAQTALDRRAHSLR